MTTTRDIDLRMSTLRAIEQRWPGGVTVHELPLFRGRARVDLAHVDHDGLRGFELKSDVDSLSRLTTQAPLYSRVFEAMTIVCAPRHIVGATRRVPRWWGIWVVDHADAAPRELREPTPNPTPDPSAWAGLLWRNEMARLLAEHSFGKTPDRRATRAELISALTDSMPTAHMKHCVRQTLLERHATS